MRLALLERLELLESDITIKTPEISALNAERRKLQSIQTDVFLSHFALIWANREGICATPELSNITFNGLGGGLAYTGPLNVTLGQLLNLYNQGLLRFGQCENCQCSYFIYWFSGSPLSGCGQYSAFCPMCHKTKYIYPYDVSGCSWRYFCKYDLPFKKEPTHWTVTTLVHALARHRTITT